MNETLKDRYTLGQFAVTATKDDEEGVSIEKFVDIACLAVGVGAYSQWLEESNKKGDALLKKGHQTAYRYSSMFNQGFEEFFAPLLERSDAGPIKQAWKRANRPGNKSDAFARKGAFLGVLIPWLKRHTQVFRDTFSGRSYQGALKIAGAVSEESAEGRLHKLALIPAMGGLRAPSKWNQDAAKAVGAEPSEPERVQTQAESLQPTIEQMRTVQSKMDVTDSDTQEAADLAANKASLASEIEEAAMESDDPDALRGSVNSQLAEQPTSKIAHEAGLTPEQTKAMLAEGKVVMTAGAGSGKSRVIAAKVAYFVKEKGYRPEQIMATSFTRKSADELKGRVKTLFGITEAEINTTHSIAGNILRRKPELKEALNKAPDFTNYLYKLAVAQVGLSPTAGGRGKYAAGYQKQQFDKGKISYLFKEAVGEWFNLGQKPEDQKGRPIGQKRLQSYTGKWKMGGWSPEKAWDFYKDEQTEYPAAYFAAAVFGAYEYLKNQNSTTAPALDFDDWLLEAVKVLKEDDQLRESMQRRFKVVMVDEAQDLNQTQHELFDIIAGKADTYAMVGDDKQCISISTMISTPYGECRADDLVPGDEVLSYRKGQVVKQTVRHVVPSSWTEGFKITTEEGRTLSMSPNHKIWATEPQTEDSQVAVYLMHRPDMGFRVGVTNKGKSKRGEGYHTSYGGRAFLEKADKMWILDICDDREEALIKEDDYSLTYGIPQTVFNGEHRGLSQSRIEELFKRHGKNGAKLLEAKHLSFDLPHWMSQSYTKHGRSRRTVQLIAHSGSGSQVALEWSGEDLDEAVRDLPKNANGKVFIQVGERRRIRRWFANYRQALQFAQDLSRATGALLREKLSTPEEALRLLTASGLHNGMKVAVQEGEGVYLDSIATIEKIQDSFVDLDIDDASNFFGGGILSHNSIYTFRGADPDLFIDKPDEGFEVESLTMNFRSGKSIVDAANRLIAHNDKQIPMVCEANVERKGMGQITCRTPDTHEKAAVEVSAEIDDSLKTGSSPSDFGIVVRNNAEKDAYTMMLAFRGIPVRGGTDIFSKPIIAATLAWLRINAGGTEDQINDAVLRAHQTPGFFLNKEFGSQLARKCGRGQSYLDYLLQGGDVYDGRNNDWRNKRMVRPYADALRKVTSLKGASDSIIAAILELQGSGDSFEDALIKNISADDLAEELGREPSESELREAALVPIQPILKMATRFNDPKKLFAVVDKLRRANQDNMTKQGSEEPAVFIATCHKWKGLEAKHVYVSMAEGVFPPPEDLLARDATPDPIIKPQTMADERRLGYVAITRGEDSVTILCPKENYRGQAAGVSQFVEEACIGIEGENKPEEDPEAEEDSPPDSRMASGADPYNFGEDLLRITYAAEEGGEPDSEMEADWEYLPEET